MLQIRHNCRKHKEKNRQPFKDRLFEVYYILERNIPRDTEKTKER
jgi:hypothetical protein